MVTANVKWIGGSNYMGFDGNGRAALMSSGGDGPGVSPMQMLLLGVGGCTMVDVISILQKQRKYIEGVEIVLEGERGADFPKPWETIHMHYIITGVGLDPAQVERAIKLSKEKYCGASATLAGVAKITYDFEIREPAALAAQVSDETETTE
ncbi:MAG: OsmC family protein [Caldilineaceae bacterium]|nr:OsmC family protein [Caldilineaceae bacterium]MBP8106052.1 OsmC family protein [Caldilineaceae bacterium]MBP8121942.1 OsmC family protein [Caldilineaceae bacterium]MBP9073372.1 OsmC family protein [Caldilineaceae bacterium]